MLCKGAPLRRVELVGVRHLRQRPDHHLRRQAGLFTHGGIAQLLQGKLPERLGVPGDLADRVTRHIGRFERAPERVGLLRRGEKFQLCGEFHSVNIPRYERLCNSHAPTRGASMRGASPSCAAPFIPQLGLKPRSFLNGSAVKEGGPRRTVEGFAQRGPTARARETRTPVRSRRRPAGARAGAWGVSRAASVCAPSAPCHEGR